MKYEVETIPAEMLTPLWALTVRRLPHDYTAEDIEKAFCYASEKYGEFLRSIERTPITWLNEDGSVQQPEALISCSEDGEMIIMREIPDAGDDGQDDPSGA